MQCYWRQNVGNENFALASMEVKIQDGATNTVKLICAQGTTTLNLRTRIDCRSSVRYTQTYDDGATC